MLPSPTYDVTLDKEDESTHASTKVVVASSHPDWDSGLNELHAQSQFVTATRLRSVFCCSAPLLAKDEDAWRSTRQNVKVVTRLKLQTASDNAIMWTTSTRNGLLLGKGKRQHASHNLPVRGSKPNTSYRHLSKRETPITFQTLSERTSLGSTIP